MLWLGIIVILLFLAFVVQMMVLQNEQPRESERINRLLNLETRG